MSVDSAILFIELFCSLLLPITAFFTLRRNQTNLIHQTFFGLTFCLFLWLFLDAMDRILVFSELYITAVLFRISDWFLTISGIVFVFFGHIFPRRSRRTESRNSSSERRSRILPLILSLSGTAFLLMALSFTDLYVRDRQYNPVDGTFEGKNGPVYYLIRIFFLFCLAAALREQRKFLIYNDRDPRRIHSRYFIYAVVMTITAAAIVSTAALMYRSPTFIYSGFAFLCSVFIYFFHNILSNRTIALRGGIYRNTVMMFTTLVLLLPTFVLINYLLALVYASSLWLLSALLCGFFILFHILEKRLSPMLGHMLFKKQSRIDDAIALFSTSILNLASGKKTDVRRQLVEFLDELYDPRFLVFYTLESDPNDESQKIIFQDRNLTRIADIESIPPAHFPDEIALMLHPEDSGLQSDGGLIVDLLAAAEKMEISQSGQTLSRFAAFGAEIILPFFETEPGPEKKEESDSSSELQAVLLLGLGKNGKPLDHTDLRLLKGLRAPALLAMKNQELLLSTTRLQKKLEEENRKITRRLSGNLPGVMQGRSASAFVFNRGGSMSRIIEQAERFAARDSPVLISGETGTGKEQVARILHGQSGRKGQLVTVNCSAIPHDLIENELFGHEKGAYTGAVDSSEGFVARARGGTLFLDEIGEMPIQGQVKLLRLVQEGDYEKIGSGETLHTDTRFVFATNRNLEDEVQSGRFRSDLFYRISTFEIRLPPLRERKDDIPLLIDHFLWLAGQTFTRPGLRMTTQAREMLVKHSWPGNVRELENLILRTVVLSETDDLDVDSLPVMFRDEMDFKRKKLQLERIMNEQARLEKELLLEALEKSGGNQRRAAEILDISRGSLQYRMKQYGLAQG